jgi:hypothetical protein
MNKDNKHLKNSITVTNLIDTNKYQVWFQDIDPDTGKISQTQLIGIAENKTKALWLVESLVKNNEDPNRDFIIAIDYSS